MSFQIYFTDETRERARVKVHVSNSEEQFKNTTVEDLRRKLLPEDQYDAVLLYKDVELEDDYTLDFYGIGHEDEIIARKITPRFSFCRSHVPRTVSMEKLDDMQQDSSGRCCIM